MIICIIIIIVHGGMYVHDSGCVNYNVRIIMYMAVDVLVLLYYDSECMCYSVDNYVLVYIIIIMTWVCYSVHVSG